MMYYNVLRCTIKLMHDNTCNTFFNNVSFFLVHLISRVLSYTIPLLFEKATLFFDPHSINLRVVCLICTHPFTTGDIRLQKTLDMSDNIS